MPTGYTCNIKDGISFKTFALNCARAFCACAGLRDEAGGGEQIPDRFYPSDYYLKKSEADRDELAALEVMTPDELSHRADSEYDNAETYRVIRLREIKELRSYYEAMLTKVESWVPPTENHCNLKQFMIDQLVKSIDFDCDHSYYDTPTIRLTGEQWYEQRREELLHDLEYHTKSYTEEVERAENNTAWITALRSSL